MKTPAAFFVSLVLAGAAAIAVLRVSPEIPAPQPSKTQRVVATPAPPATATKRPLILAGHSSTFTFATSLAQGTTIDVGWAWPEDAAWSDQLEVPVSTQVASAVAVITMRNAASDDLLFAAARAKNLSIVEIDATLAADQRTSVVRQTPLGRGGPAPSAPLSLTNAARMAEVIARDFIRLSPPDEKRIGENLRALKERIFRLRAQAEGRLASAENVDVALGSPVFAEFAADLGLTICPPEDTGVAALLSTHSSTGVAGSVPVIVLDPLSTHPMGPDDYFRAMEKNLNSVADVLAPATSR